jgi:peptide/nickel transport system permease protein
MVTYILKRFLFFIPTLLIISLAAFWISVNSPGDPVDNFAGSGSEFGFDQVSLANMAQFRDKRERVREKYNLHLPVFYFGIGSLSEPDTLYRFFEPDEKFAVENLLSRSGNWPAVQQYHRAVLELRDKERRFFEENSIRGKRRKREAQEYLLDAHSVTQALLAQSRPEAIEGRFYQLDTLLAKMDAFAPLDSQLKEVEFAYNDIEKTATPWKNYIPSLKWYGTENQYHKWIWSTLTKLDFGYSYSNGQAISERIGDLFLWSFFFSISSALLAYLISIPLGIMGAVFQNSRFDKVTTVTVFAMDSLPNFWVATLLLVTFANPDMLNWFPSSFNELDTGPGRFVLPMIAYTYGSIAYTSRIMRASMLDVIQQDYIRTAYAKGLAKWVVLTRHAARNALLPIVTAFAGLLPAMLGGHVILESVFSIPGMGREIFEATFSKDIPMIMAVFTLTGFLTIMGYLVSDILYTIADPRIRIENAE